MIVVPALAETQQWYEIDISWWEIRFLQTIGLATSVRRASLPFKLQPPVPRPPNAQHHGVIRLGCFLPRRCLMFGRLLVAQSRLLKRSRPIAL